MAKRKYFRAVQDFFGNLKKEVTFHELNSVSLELTLPAFCLCSVIVAFGVVAFAVENLKLLVCFLKIAVNVMKGMIPRMFHITIWITGKCIIIRAIFKSS